MSAMNGNDNSFPNFLYYIGKRIGMPIVCLSDIFHRKIGKQTEQTGVKNQCDQVDKNSGDQRGRQYTLSGGRVEKQLYRRAGGDLTASAGKDCFFDEGFVLSALMIYCNCVLIVGHTGFVLVVFNGIFYADNIRKAGNSS